MVVAAKVKQSLLKRRNLTTICPARHVYVFPRCAACPGPCDAHMPANANLMMRIPDIGLCSQFLGSRSKPP